jgi:hypothetical protein
MRGSVRGRWATGVPTATKGASRCTKTGSEAYGDVTGTAGDRYVDLVCRFGAKILTTNEAQIAAMRNGALAGDQPALAS